MIGYKSYVAKPKEVNHKWYVVNAEGKTLGRLAADIASRLRGKHKPTYTPHTDCGDFIIVVNAEKIHVTGNKRENKKYYRYTGYVGNLKTFSFSELQERSPNKIIELAVRGMLPRGPLGRCMFKKLKVYTGLEHPHQAQEPIKLEL